MYWGKSARRKLECHQFPAGAPDINVVLAFLGQRLGPAGVAILSSLGPPIRHSRGWYRLARCEYPQQQDELAALGWVRAWHGTRFEAVFSTLCQGRLYDSRDARRGELMVQDVPGIYTYPDGACQKAGHHARFVRLGYDGVFWSAMWELYVDREQRKN